MSSALKMSKTPPSSLFVTEPTLPPLEEFLPYLEEIWNSKILTNGGPIHQKLEQALCDYLGVQYVALFANGSIALMASLKALGITGEVITTPYTFIATTHSINWCGCTPVFVDVDPKTFNLDPNKIEAAINENTTAILPVHCYGTPCDTDAIQSIADRHDLQVVYDAAHAFSVQDSGGSVLRHGDMSVLSFHATKVFNTFEGGAIVCKDRQMLDRINHLKNHGIVNQTTVDQLGINGKLSEVAAAFGLAQLPYMDNALSSRKKIDAAYRKGLSDVCGLQCVTINHSAVSNYGYFPILVEESFRLTRDELYQSLVDQGIYSRRYFYPITSEFPVYAGLPSSGVANLPVATRLSSKVLCLPIFPDMSAEQQNRVLKAIQGIG